MNKARTFALILGAAVLLGGLLVVVQFRSSSASAQTGGRLGPYIAEGPSTLPTGVPAIKPTLGKTDAATPAFTAAEVTAYIASMGPTAGMGKIGSSTAPQITSVEFVTERELKSRLQGEGTGLPDDTLLCYVELSGNFTVYGPGGRGRSAKKAIEVFDAHTGNLMLFSA